VEEIRYKTNELYCEDVALSDVAAAHGTPAYVYSRRSIIDHTRWIERAFGDLDHLSCYAVKANASRELLKVIAGEGIGADVGSYGELQLALDAGFSPSLITYSGVGKRDDEMAFALKQGIMAFNVESREELDVLAGIAQEIGVTARILLRVNFDIVPGTHPYIATGGRESKFGVAASEAKSILVNAQKHSSISVLGIHTHLGSQIIESASFLLAANAAVAMVEDLRKEGIPVSQLNFGGGFGVQYRDFVKHPGLLPEENHREEGLTTVGMLGECLHVLRRARCKILIQPGRSIIAHAGVMLTRVLFRKETHGKRFVIVDAGMNDLLRPSLYQSYHQIVPSTITQVDQEVVDVVGPLCETGDFFARERRMPVSKRGDLLAVLCAGAYGYVLSSNYNGRPRPVEVLVDGTNFSIITERESVQQLFT
jgi:diaminopimelate decarboxylase